MKLFDQAACAPLTKPGGARGVLVLHDLGGGPGEVLRLVDLYATSGYTVEAPLLPGHGLDPAPARFAWGEWREAARAAAAGLAARGEKPAVVGVGLGAWLALGLAAEARVVKAVAIQPLDGLGFDEAKLWVRSLLGPVELERAALSLAAPGVPLIGYDPLAFALVHEACALRRWAAGRLGHIECGVNAVRIGPPNPDPFDDPLAPDLTSVRGFSSARVPDRATALGFTPSEALKETARGLQGAWPMGGVPRPPEGDHIVR